MTHTEPTSGADDLARLVSAIRRDIDLDNLKLPREYFYASLPLCVIDAVFSIGVTYTSTENTVARFCQGQGWARFKDEGAEQRIVSEFVGLLSHREPDDLATGVFGNRQRTSSTSGILKAEAVVRFAAILRDHGVERFGDTEDLQSNAFIEKAVREIPGQGSGISFEYFLMLAGSDQFVKADRMICRYVGRALGMNAATTPAEARKLLVAAAGLLGEDHADITPRSLDYAVWSSKRAQASAQ